MQIFEKGFAHYEMYTRTLCLSYKYENQKSRIQTVYQFDHVLIFSQWREKQISKWSEDLSRQILKINQMRLA